MANIRLARWIARSTRNPLIRAAARTLTRRLIQLERAFRARVIR